MMRMPLPLTSSSLEMTMTGSSLTASIKEISDLGSISLSECRLGVRGSDLLKIINLSEERNMQYDKSF